MLAVALRRQEANKTQIDSLFQESRIQANRIIHPYPRPRSCVARLA